MSRRTANSKYYIRYKIKGINRCSFLLYWFWHKSHYENVPFEIPANWCWTTLGEVFTLQAGKNITAKGISDKQDSTYPFPCYGGNGLRGYVSSYNRTGRFPLIGRQGALCGNINVADGLFYATEHAVVVESYCNIDVDWAVYALIYLNLNQYATSTAQPGLSVATINEVLLPVPPIDEQKRIANEIEKWFDLIKEIESGKVELESYIKQTKSKILDLAISGKLVPQDTNDETAIELLKRINPGFKPCDNSHYENLPQGWVVCRLEDVCQICDNQRQPINSTERQERKKRAQTLYPYYGATGQVDWIDDYMLDGTFILLGEDGAPFLEKFADKAYVVSGKIWVNNHAHILKPNCDITYLTYYLNRYDYSKCVNGSTRLKLTQADMKNMTIVLPPLAEQHRIAGRIENIFRMLDAITAEL